MEAHSNEEMKCHHGSFQLSTHHVLSHRIVLSMSCDHLRALFHSGMHEGFSDVMRVPIGWKALDKLASCPKSPRLPVEEFEQRSAIPQLNAYALLHGGSEGGKPRSGHLLPELQDRRNIHRVCCLRVWPEPVGDGGGRHQEPRAPVTQASGLQGPGSWSGSTTICSTCCGQSTSVQQYSQQAARKQR